MEESYGFSTTERMSDQWQLGATSALSMNSDTSLFNKKNYHLHLIQKREAVSERKIIPSTKAERFSYFRSYVSSINKTQIICMQHERFNMFIWNYVLTTVFKSLPHTYSYIFLAAYSSEEHMFLSKMVPVFLGFKFSSIIAAIFEILSYIDTTLIIFDYIYKGIIYKNPWNRCNVLPDSTYYYHTISNVTWKCYNVREFRKKIMNVASKNETVSFNKYYYVHLNETFQLAQVEYYRGRNLYFSHFQIGSCIYFGILWISVTRFHGIVYSKLFWKVLNAIQWSVNGIDLMTFVYTCMSYYAFSNEPTSTVFKDRPKSHLYTDVLWESDIEMLAESTTSPPVVHVLTARGLGEIQPSRDSAMLVASNALLFLFRGILHYRLKYLCEKRISVPIFLTIFNHHSWFYIWPLYFSRFYLGDIFTLVFLLTNFAMEFCTIIVTYHCLFEAIVCEYTKFRKYGDLILMIIGICIFVLTGTSDRMILYVYSVSITTLIETIVMYCMYPLGRLVDDITFHYGTPPSSLRVLSLQLVPIYYTVKVYFMGNALYKFISYTNYRNVIPHFKWSWCLIVLPVVLGVFYQSYIYVVKYKREWKFMFRPNPKWGPRDYTSRDLRKQYDSRTYIGSQAPKNLGRDLLYKTESKAYKLDVRYDLGSRRSTLPTLDFLRDDVRKSFEQRKSQDMSGRN